MNIRVIFETCQQSKNRWNGLVGEMKLNIRNNSNYCTKKEMRLKKYNLYNKCLGDVSICSF